MEITPVLAEAVKRGTLDLVFAAQSISAPDIRTRPLPTWRWCSSARSAMKRRAPYTLAEIVSSEMMTFQRGSQPHLALLEQLRGEGLEPPRLHAVSSIPAMVHLIESGFGIATLPIIAAQRWCAGTRSRSCPARRRCRRCRCRPATATTRARPRCFRSSRTP